MVPPPTGSAEHYRCAIKRNWSMNIGKAVRALADERAKQKTAPQPTLSFPRPKPV